MVIPFVYLLKINVCSVASAFRPYHQHPNPRKYTKEHRRSNEAFDDYPVYIQHHPDHGLSHPHEHYSRPFGFSQQNPRRHGQDHSKNNQGFVLLQVVTG